jgi:polygalacturonase
MKWVQMTRASRRVSFESLEARWLQAAQLPALSSLPVPSDSPQPASHPALPAGFDAFAPQLSGAPASSGTPTVAEWTRTAGPNQSIVMTEDQLDPASASVVVFGETRSTNGTLSEATVDRVNDGAASVTLPGNVPADSMYLLWTQNSIGYGPPVAVNRAEAWWVGPDAASPGQNVSIYGRNLTLAGDVRRAAVYLEPGPGNTAAPRWVTVTGANPYQLTVSLPADLPAGNWQVWAHNGHGGEYGWSDPVSLTVRAAQPWNGPVFNVKKFGAKGNGVTDDQNAIRAAITAAEQIPGSTVFLPAGNYLVNGGFDSLHDVRVLGAGMGATVIKAGPAFAAQHAFDGNLESLFFMPTSNVEFANLGLSANGNLGGSLPQLVYVRDATDIRFTNVSFDARGFHPADTNGSHRISFTGCRFTGEEIFLGTATQVQFNACHFYMTDDTESALTVWGGHEISLTNNIVQNLNASNPNSGAGWGAGRFVDFNEGWGSASNVYLSNNTTIALGVRSGYADQNVGEQINCEGTITAFDGYAAAGSSNTVQLAGYTGAALGPGMVVTIVAGTGMGQTRAVTSSSADVVTLASAWNVVPDATSRVVVETLAQRLVMYSNLFTGRPQLVVSTSPTANCGIEMYEGASDVIVDSNTFQRIRAGVSLWGGAENTTDLTEVEPLMFSYVANNRFFQVRLGILWVRRASDAGTPFVGNVVRGNRLVGAIQSAMEIATNDQWASLTQIPDVNVVETTVSNVPGASQLDFTGPSRAAGGVLLRSNSFDGGSVAAATPPLVGAAPPSSNGFTPAPAPAPIEAPADVNSFAYWAFLPIWKRMGNLPAGLSWAGPSA